MTDWDDLDEILDGSGRVQPMARSPRKRGKKVRSNGRLRDNLKRQDARNAVALGEYTDRDRGCAMKRAYATRHRAECAARFLSERHGHELRPYKCRYCSGWHLTKQPDPEESLYAEN